MKKWIFRISIMFNILFLLAWAWSNINIPSYKLGRLQKNIEIGYFTKDSVIFTLPKDLTVRDVSERGLSAVGQFENERFAIVITSDDESLVNYNLHEDSLNPFGNFYSADIRMY